MVVEVHRSEEVDDSVATSKSTPTLERLTADEVRDKINHRCFAALITVLYFPTFICYSMIMCQEVTLLVLLGVVCEQCASVYEKWNRNRVTKCLIVWNYILYQCPGSQDTHQNENGSSNDKSPFFSVLPYVPFSHLCRLFCYSIL